MALARDAEVAVIFVGNTYQWESEGQDMGAMVLPPYNNRAQDALISAIAAVNDNTIVVANTGVPFEVPWIESVPGFLQGWYAGQEVGNALIDVLFGEMTPSGKLPISWPRVYEHTACYGHFGLDAQDSKEVEYVEGVFVGYRHYDRHWKSEKEVVFPFGYGLSYTDFEITDVTVDGDFSEDTTSSIVVTATVKNVGNRRGAQTVQVYVAPPQNEAVERPVKELAGFSKVHLQAGKEDKVHIEVNIDAAAFWDEAVHKWRVTPGSYGILVATSAHPDHVVSQVAVRVEKGFIFNP